MRLCRSNHVFKSGNETVQLALRVLSTVPEVTDGCLDQA